MKQKWTDEAAAFTAERCKLRFGHLGDVVVTLHNSGDWVGVGLTLNERSGEWRHAVCGATSRAAGDLAGFADAVGDKMLAWHAGRQADDEGPGGLEGDEELIC